MDENLEIKDFDILGLITLKDINGIEKYVTPLRMEEKQSKKMYLSRSKEYYNVKTMSELSEEREELKDLLTTIKSKRNFVILENMLNCSGKVYFKKVAQSIKTRNPQLEVEMNIAKKCLEEDVSNILKLLSKEGLIQVRKSLKLPGGEENSEKRLIEMDNKAILYTFCKSLALDRDEKDKEILIPGYGSIYIGPFIKDLYGYDYTNLLKSNYIEETNPDNETKSIKDLVTSQRIFAEDKQIILLDDNIGTGKTMDEIKEKLKQEGKNDIISGAVQYNWINYYRISTGEKQKDKNGNKIKRFNIKDYEIVSPINYYGHKLCETAIDMLHSSGDEYVEYLKSKSYRLENYNDLIGAIERGLQYSEMTGATLTDTYEYEKRKERETKERLEEYIGEETTSDTAKEYVDSIIKTITDSVGDKKTIIKER